MKKFFFFALLAMISVVANAQTLLVDGSLKVKLGSATLTVEEGAWYAVGNSNSTSTYVSVADGKLVAGTNPADQLAGDVAAQLVRFTAVEGGYTVQTATGEYWGTMTAEGTPTVTENAPAYTIGTASSRSKAAYFAQTNGETTLIMNKDMTGSTAAAPTTSKDDLAWKIYPVTLKEIVPVAVTYTATTIDECDKVIVSVKNEDSQYRTIESGAEFLPDNTIKVEASCGSGEHYVLSATVNNKSVTLTEGVYEFTLTDEGAAIAVTFARVPHNVEGLAGTYKLKNNETGLYATYGTGYYGTEANLGEKAKLVTVSATDDGYYLQFNDQSKWIAQNSWDNQCYADGPKTVYVIEKAEGGYTIGTSGKYLTYAYDSEYSVNNIVWGTTASVWTLETLSNTKVTYTVTTAGECDKATVSVKNEDGTYTAIESGAEVAAGSAVKVEAACEANTHVAAVTVGGTKVKLTNGAYEFTPTEDTAITIAFAEKPQPKTVYAHVNKNKNWANLPYEEGKDYYTVKVEVTGDDQVKVLNWNGVEGNNLTVTFDPSTNKVTEIAEADDEWIDSDLDVDGQGYYGFYIYTDYSTASLNETQGSLSISCYAYNGEQSGYPYINVDWYMDNRYDPSRPEPKTVDAKVLKTVTTDNGTYTNWSRLPYGEDGIIATQVELSDGTAVVSDWTGSGDKLTINYNTETGYVTSIAETTYYEGYGYWLSTTADIDNYASYPGCYLYYDGYSTVNVKENGGLILISCYSYNENYPYIIVQWGEGVATAINNVEQNNVKNGKFIQDGKIVIVKNGNHYNVAGQAVK